MYSYIHHEWIPTHYQRFCHWETTIIWKRDRKVLYVCHNILIKPGPNLLYLCITARTNLVQFSPLTIYQIQEVSHLGCKGLCFSFLDIYPYQCGVCYGTLVVNWSQARVEKVADGDWRGADIHWPSRVTCLGPGKRRGWRGGIEKSSSSRS